MNNLEQPFLGLEPPSAWRPGYARSVERSWQHGDMARSRVPRLFASWLRRQAWACVGACSLFGLLGCEIVSSSLPFDFSQNQEEPNAEPEGQLPSYPGLPCGEKSLTWCSIPKAAPDEAAPALRPARAGELPEAIYSFAPFEGELEAGAPLSDEPGEALSLEAGAPSEEWCALRCTLSCEAQRWQCIGPVQCGSSPASRPAACQFD